MIDHWIVITETTAISIETEKEIRTENNQKRQQKRTAIKDGRNTITADQRRNTQIEETTGCNS